jgi:guanine deaminase
MRLRSGNPARRHAVRGSILHFLDDPARHDAASAAFEYHEDGVLVVEGGHVSKVGSAPELLGALGRGTPVEDLTGMLLMPGFIDAHTHFVQTDIIGSHGLRLLEWLERHTFPAERAFADIRHGEEVAEFFVQELLRNGTTTALVMGSVHASSVDAIFAAAQRRDMRLIAGKVLMDRNCPEDLRDSAESGYAQSKALIGKWHGQGRLQYAITPRFAPTSTPEQLAAAGRLAAEHRDAFVHTHLSENEEEVEWARRLFPERRNYLDVYDHYGLLRRRSVLAHAIWVDEEELRRIAEAQAAVVHCPTCNLAMGSGLFDLRRVCEAGGLTALGTDIGGGTSFSLLRVMDEAYKVAQLRRDVLSPLRAFYLATLGAARALDLEDRIGSFSHGREADFIVLDPAATPLLARRTGSAATLAEKLSVLMTLGDERVVARTYVAGRMLHER